MGENRYSLKKRISSTYIRVYVGICVLIILSFVTGSALYVRDKYEEPSVQLAGEIAMKIYGDDEVSSDEMRTFLYEKCLLYGTKEVFVYDSDEELITATSYVEDNAKYFSACENSSITGFLPSFTNISDGIYITDQTKTVLIEGQESVIRVIMYHPVHDELAIFRYLINMSFVLLFTGLVLFIVFGVSRTHKMLMPITEMTEIAKKISGENMSLRFGDTGARFELSELASTINSMMDRIEESYDRQKRFVSDVSHELRTPISVISGYANMLRRWGREDEEILNEGIENIIQEADTMSELVLTLLFLARHDNDTLKYEPKDMDVSAMVADIVKDAVLANPGVNIISEIDGSVTAYIDEARIRQAVRVFIDNGIKYSEGEDKQLFISLKKYDEHFEIMVKDNGIGISEGDLRNIFERFYRADESRTKSTGGYGLGLSIAKVIVIAHGGKIKVRSKPGEGSEFIIIMPYKSIFGDNSV